MQDYKSLCAVITICSTLINVQTDTQVSTHTDSIFISSLFKAQRTELKILCRQFNKKDEASVL